MLQKTDFLELATMMEDLMTMMDTHVCPICGGTVEQTTEEGDIVLTCTGCGYTGGISGGLLDGC